MPSAPSAGFVRRALAGHSAVGLVAGALLYILCVTGSAIVIHEEWQRWEQPRIAEARAVTPAAVQRGVETVLASEAGKPVTTHLYVHLPNDALPRTVVTTDHQAVYLDAAGAIAGPEAHAWTEFLIDLHLAFHLPRLFGLTLVGLLGVMMAALVVGGVLAHPRIFRDAFRLRARGPRQLAYADWHNRLGVWTLPFGLAVALTGAVLGLATVMAVALAALAFDGDRDRVFAPIFGDEPAADARPAPLPDIAAALAAMPRIAPGVAPSYVILHDPGTKGQQVQILGDHPRRLIFGDYYHFDAAGRFHGKAGLSDGRIGQQAAASVYKLHFGSFGGLAVKLAYMACGLALSAITATGLWLWLMKRRQRGSAAPRLEAMWSALVWAVPLLLVLAAPLRWALGPAAPLTGFFWIGLAALLAAAAGVQDAERCSRLARGALAAALLGVAGLHWLVLAPVAPALLAIDAGLALAGLGLGLTVARAGTPARRPARAEPGAAAANTA